MNKQFKPIWRWLGMIPVFAMLCAIVPAVAGAEDEAPPGVARMSTMSGDVVVRRGDSGSDVAGNINAPLMAGDYLSTRDGRAEVQMDATDALRVGGETQLRFTQMDPGAHTLQIAQGTIELRVFRGLEGHPQIETPSVTIRPDEPGRYRVSVNGNGASEITVRTGRADIVTPQGTQALSPGSTLVAEGPASNPSFRTAGTLAFDSFDQWNAERDRMIERALADHNVNQDMVGAADLDQYGRWVNVDGYGEVWQPNNEPADWSPYSDGSWTWENYYGWTWVGYEPWGWAPYHYGRWFYAANYGWAWYPGPAYVAPVWEPALVGFVGFGGGWGLSVGFGGGWGFGTIGWVPLGPWEPFHPWWGPGFWGGRWGRTTIVNNYNITKIYQNAGAPHGVVGVPGRSFGEGNFNHIASIPPSRFGGAAPVRGPLPVAPGEHNLAFNNHPVPGGAAPNPGRFGSFPTRPSAPGRTLAQDRQSIQSIAQHAAPANGSQAGRENPVAGNRSGEPAVGSRSEGAAEHAAASTEHSGAAAADRAASAGSSWSRFNEQRGVSSERAAGSTMERAAGSAERNAGSAADRAAGSTERAGNDGWSRFGSDANRGSANTTERSNPWSSGAWGSRGTSTSAGRSGAGSSSGWGARGWGGSYSGRSQPSYSRPSTGSGWSRPSGSGSWSRPGGSWSHPSAPSHAAPPASHSAPAPASHGGGGGHR